jgi:cell division transport system ATP-binding protein
MVLDKDTPGGILLKLKEVTKVFDKKLVALDKISCQMEDEDFCFLVGPNKAGKTTLLRLIALEEKPSEGEIIFGEFSSRTVRRREIPFLRQKIGRIFSDFRLINDMDVFDNAALSLRICGRKESKIKNKVHRVLGMVGLSGKGRLFPNDLSAGEKQKVAIARAIASDPLLLLADEPTMNLDEESTDEILGLLKQINLLGTMILLATHDSRLCTNNSARIIKIENGKLV